MREACDEKEQNLHNILKMVTLANTSGDLDYKDTIMDDVMKDFGKTNPNSYAVKTYNQFRVAAAKTLRCILISIGAKLGRFDN